VKPVGVAMVVFGTLQILFRVRSRGSTCGSINGSTAAPLPSTPSGPAPPVGRPPSGGNDCHVGVFFVIAGVAVVVGG
jgi:hypothetical protein